MRLERNPKKRKINPITATKRIPSRVISLWKSSENKVDMYECLFYKGIFTFLEGNELFKSCSRVSKRFKEMVELTRTKLVFGECPENDSETLFSPIEHFDSAIKARQSGCFASINSITICGILHKQFGEFIGFNEVNGVENDGAQTTSGFGLDWLEEIELIDLSNETSFKLALEYSNSIYGRFTEIAKKLTEENLKEVIDYDVSSFPYTATDGEGALVESVEDIRLNAVRCSNVRNILGYSELRGPVVSICTRLFNAYAKSRKPLGGHKSVPERIRTLQFVNLKSIKVVRGRLGSKALLSIIFHNLHTLTTLELDDVVPHVDFCDDFDCAAREVSKKYGFIKSDHEGHHARSKLSKLVLDFGGRWTYMTYLSNPFFSMLTDLEICACVSGDSLQFINGEHMPRLRRLSVNVHGSPLASFRNIGKVPLLSLKSLSLHNFELDGLDPSAESSSGKVWKLDCVGSFPFIEELDLSKSKPSHTFIAHVANGRLPELRKLVLRDTGIGEEFIDHLYSAEKSVDGEDYESGGLTNVPFGKLTELDLGLNDMTDKALSIILKHRFRVSQKHLDSVSGKPRLKLSNKSVVHYDDESEHWLYSLVLGNDQVGYLELTLDRDVIRSMSRQMKIYMYVLQVINDASVNGV